MLIKKPLTEIDSLRLRLEEAEETLRAIGNGEVDVFVVSGPDGEQVFSLKGAEQPYRVLVETMNEGAATLAADGTILYCNNRLAKMLQVPLERLIGMELGSYVALTDHPLFAALLKKCLLECTSDEMALITGNGNSVSVMISCCSLDLTGSRGISAVITDLTQQKHNEENIALERLASSIIEQAGEAIIVCDEGGIIIRASQLAHQLCGVNPLLKPFNELFRLQEINSDGLFSVLTAQYGGFIKNVEVVFNRSDNQVFHLLLNATPLKSVHNSIIGCVVTLTDLTERKQAEEEKVKLEAQLQQAQKMESVGRLAGGVAHDFNNMLSVILGHAELALMKSDPSQPLHASLGEIHKAAERSTNLTRQLLAFARKQTVSPKVLDLNETVSSMFKMLQRLIGEDIFLNWQPGKDLHPVKMDPSQIDQILANLCVNARDAIADVGKISIETGNIFIDDNYCAHHAGFESGEYVWLGVSDNGCGMDKEMLAQIFEPFFTTKAVGEGTGLGLATVYGAVKQNNGFINVYSEPGLGTTFSIYLPRYVGMAEKTLTEGQLVPVSRGQETILLVDDEPAILNITTMILTQQGYKVLASNTPDEAISMAKEHIGEIHLLLTDVVMPEMNGLNLAEALQPLHPQLKRLFMSGYTADVIANRGVLNEGVHFIHKPFSLPDLATKVREVLDIGQLPA
jgi:PAS domain S-box-containing protein